MNQNYVRKCEEYLQNIPSQKLPPASTGGASRPNLSSRKLTQPGLRQGRQSINNAIPPPVLPPPPAEGSRPKPKPPPPSTPVPATGGRRTPCRPPTARPGQLGSKFIRPCCRPKGRDTAAERAGRRGSDNVNQNDVRVMDGAGAGGGGEGRATGKTKTWDGILTAESTVETTAVASLTQIKSKVSEGMSFFCISKILPTCFMIRSRFPSKWIAEFLGNSLIIRNSVLKTCQEYKLITMAVYISPSVTL